MSACYSSKKHSFIFRIWAILQKWYRPTSNPHNKIPLAIQLEPTRSDRFCFHRWGQWGPWGPCPIGQRHLNKPSHLRREDQVKPALFPTDVRKSLTVPGWFLDVEYVESALINKRKEISEGSGPMTSAEFCAKVACQQHQLTTAAI